LNLFDSSGYFFAKLRYYFWGKLNKKRFLAFYLHKTWGPPTGKYFMRGFYFDLPKEKLAELAAREAEYERKYWPNRAASPK
jgi:hypothetical protein